MKYWMYNRIIRIFDNKQFVKYMYYTGEMTRLPFICIYIYLCMNFYNLNNKVLKN